MTLLWRQRKAGDHTDVLRTASLQVLDSNVLFNDLFFSGSDVNA